MSTSTQWSAVQAINSAGINTNTTTRSTKNANFASTWQNSGGEHYMVIDLGQVRTFNAAYFYQTFSDGKVTSGSLAYASGALPTRTSGSWTNAFSGWSLSNNTTPTRVGFSPVTAQYVRVGVSNNGSYGFSTFVELFQFKLFYEAF